MTTTDKIELARPFATLRLLIDEVNRLKGCVAIDGYSIHRNAKGGVMGARQGETWAYLA